MSADGLARARLWALAGGLPALLLGLGLLASVLLSRRLVAVTVRGTSMEPTYRDGDWVLVRRGLPPLPGQVVVAEPALVGPPWRDVPVRRPGQRWWLVKRVAAVPGDPVPRADVPALADVPEQRVPAGKLVLLGDNQYASLDSRRLGYFPAERVLGTVVRRLTSGATTARPTTSRASCTATTSSRT